MRKSKFRLSNLPNERFKVPLMVAGVIIVGLLAWLIIRVITMETALFSVVSYQLPEFKSLNNLYELSDGEYAVAVDGKIGVSSGDLTARPTASTAKMILGLAVMREKPFEAGSYGETITIDDEMYDRYAYYLWNGGSNTRVYVGEEISEYDALMSVFLASSNNMADALAIWAFGSLDNYRDYATRMLGELGLTNTTIGPDASGFDEGTTSTAADLAQLGKLILEEPVLREIVGTKSYEVPVAGLIENTNQLLGERRIVGVKTGWIGEASGYCLVSGYMEGPHTVTLAMLGAPTRDASFDDSLAIVTKLQELIPETPIIHAGDILGYYDSWWTGLVPLRATEDLKAVGWAEAESNLSLDMDGDTGLMSIAIGNYKYQVGVAPDDYSASPSLGDRLAHAFGWTKAGEPADNTTEEAAQGSDLTDNNDDASASEITANELENGTNDLKPITGIPSDNCTIKYGYLMLVNPNYPVAIDFIDARRSELVSISELYGIVEGNPYNGDNLLDAEAAVHLNEMVKAYEADYPGHTFETRSCYRARGTTCGRLCAATGTSDHHTGLTCDLLDPVYGTLLDTDEYEQHIDWQWLYANSYKYGFIDRFPEEWAGGPMSEPANVDENGSTGLYETWHYRYVGVGPATEIATGKYNNGRYDSLEHYLKARGLVTDLVNGKCE